jgi:cytochrome c oxidase cbb3-type subunit III
MTAFFNSWVILLTTLNVAGCVWLLLYLRKRRGESASTSDTTGHVWDGDLAEYNNPLPRWWLWLFVITVVFSIVYLVLYPGLGNVRGTLSWTQNDAWRVMQKEQEARLQAVLAPFAGKAPAELAGNAAAVAIGRNFFANECAQCHGADARGATGFPNLTDGDWLWGGTPQAIETSIREGRMGAMTPWKDVLGAQGVEDMVAHVLSLSGRTSSAGDVKAGAQQFATFCAVCHGAEGKGNIELGAPNLTDQIWLRGGSVDAIRTTIENGAQGEMPAQGQRLGDTRVRVLAAYVLSLGEARVAGAR